MTISWSAAAPSMLVAACLLLAGLANCQNVEPATVDVLDKDWVTFQCDYNAARDTGAKNELGVAVQQCSEPVVMAANPDKFNLVAAVFGRLTAAISEEMKARFMNNQNDPVYYANTQNAMVQDGLVQILDGSNTNSIRIRIKATARTDRICAICAQSAGSIGYTNTKKISLKIRRPPTGDVTVNGVSVTANQRMELSQNQAANIVCTANGPEALTAKLLKNGRVIASSPGPRVEHKVAGATKEDGGVYRCEVATSLRFLVERNSHTGGVEFVLAVKFAPYFKVAEIVRYTPVDKKEDIRISVPAYPQAELTCSPNHPSGASRLENYNDKEFVATYQLTLTNLNKVLNETKFDCTARNEVGEKKLSIRLTARAPVPEILSQAQTKWHNSYELMWQHDRNASIDVYQVEIVYKKDGDVANKTQTDFHPNEYTGPNVAVLRNAEVSGKTVHTGVVFSLNPNSDHEVRLRACNRHGCSNFTSPVRVKTPSIGKNTYNDPKNPQLSSTGSCSPLVACVAVLLASILCLTVSQQHHVL